VYNNNKIECVYNNNNNNKIECVYNNNNNKIECVYNNNNNNLFSRSRPSQTPNWCMRPPCLWGKGPPSCSDLSAKICGGIHTVPPSGFEPVTSKEETHTSGDPS
jgi:hypothetical protein